MYVVNNINYAVSIIHIMHMHLIINTFCGLHLQTFIGWLSCTILLLNGNGLSWEDTLVNTGVEVERCTKMVSCWISIPTHICHVVEPLATYIAWRSFKYHIWLHRAIGAGPAGAAATGAKFGPQ